VKDEEVIDFIYHVLLKDNLTGRAMEDACTDGYEVKYVLLAQKIFNICKENTE